MLSYIASVLYPIYLFLDAFLESICSTTVPPNFLFHAFLSWQLWECTQLTTTLAQSQKSCKCDFQYFFCSIATQWSILPFFPFIIQVWDSKHQVALYPLGMISFFALEGSHSVCIQCNKLKESDENKCKVLSSRLDIYKLLFCQIFFLSLLMLLQLSKQ